MTSEVYYAQSCLFDFVKGVEELYGLKHTSFNIHLLLHLSHSVINWGPLWTHSAFWYEDFNQDLKSFVKSSQSIGLQIVDSFRSKCVLLRIQQICVNDLTNSQTKYLSRLLNKKYRPQITFETDYAGMLGKEKNIEKLPRRYFLALQRLNINITESKLQFYFRAIICNEVIHSKCYGKVTKRNSYTVLLKNDQIFEIELFIVLINNITSISKCYALGNYYERCSQRPSLFRMRRLEHLIFLKKSLESNYMSAAAVEASMIAEKVTIVSVPHIDIACVHPNHLELLT